MQSSRRTICSRIIFGIIVLLIPAWPGAVAPAGVAPVQACPPAPRLQRPHVPAHVALTTDQLELSVFDVKVRGEELHVWGDLENLAETTFQNVRIQGTAFGLAGRQVGAAMVLERAMEPGDLRGFRVVFGTDPPPLWLRFEVVDYRGRQAGHRLHAVQVPIDVREYRPLAQRRVRVGAIVVPNAQASRHRVCVFISDPAGFPVQSVRVLAVLLGSAQGVSIRKAVTVQVTAGQSTGVLVEWSSSVRVSPQLALESVEFAPLPRPESTGTP